MTSAIRKSEGDANASGSHCLRFTAIGNPRTRPSSSADGQGRSDVAETLRERQKVVKTPATGAKLCVFREEKSRRVSMEEPVSDADTREATFVANMDARA